MESPTPEREKSAHGEDTATPAASKLSAVEFVSPATANTPTAEDRGSPVRRYMTVDNVMDQELHLAEGAEPATFAEAQHEEGWHKAMAEEMHAI
jgi:hypothetical protein